MNMNETDKGYKAYKKSPYYHKYMEMLETIPEETVDEVIENSKPVFQKKKKMNVASFFVVLFGLLYLAVSAVGYFVKVENYEWLTSCLSIYNNMDGVTAVMGFIQDFPAFTADNAWIFVQMILFALSVVLCLVGIVGGLISIVQKGTGKLMKIGCSVFFVFTGAYQLLGYLLNDIYSYGTFITVGLAFIIFLATVCNVRKRKFEELQQIAIAKANGTYKKKQLNPVSFFVSLFGLLYIVLAGIGYFVNSGIDWVQSILSVSRTLDGVTAILHFIESVPAVFTVDNIMYICQIGCFMLSVLFAVFAFFGGLFVIVKEETGKLMKAGCSLFAIFAVASTVLGSVLEMNYFIGSILIAEFAICALICSLLGKKKTVKKVKKVKKVEEVPVQEEPVEENYLDFVPNHYEIEEYLAGPATETLAEEEPQEKVEAVEAVETVEEVVPAKKVKKGKRMNVASFFIFFFSLLYIACCVVGKFYQPDIAWLASLLGVYNGVNAVDVVINFINAVPDIFTTNNILPLCQLFSFFIATVFAVFGFVGGLIAICKKNTGKLMKVGCAIYAFFAILSGVFSYYLNQTYTYGMFAVMGLGFLCFLTAVLAKGKKSDKPAKKVNSASLFVVIFSYLFIVVSILGYIIRTDIEWLAGIFAVQNGTNGVAAIIGFVDKIPGIFTTDNILYICQTLCYAIAVVLAFIGFIGGLVAITNKYTGKLMKAGCSLFAIFALASGIMEYVATQNYTYGMIAVVALAVLTCLTAVIAKKEPKHIVTLQEEIVTLVDSSVERSNETEDYGEKEAEPARVSTESVLIPMLNSVADEEPTVEEAPVAKPKKKMNIISFFIAFFSLIYLVFNAVGYFLKDIQIDWLQSLFAVYNETNGVDAIMSFIQGLPDTLGNIVALVEMICYALSLVLALCGLIGGLVVICRKGTGKLMKAGCALLFIFTIAVIVLNYTLTAVFTYGLIVTFVLTFVIFQLAITAKNKQEVQAATEEVEEQEEEEEVETDEVNDEDIIVTEAVKEDAKKKVKKFNLASFFVALFGLLTILVSGLGYFIKSDNALVNGIFAVFNGGNGVDAVIAFIKAVPGNLTVENIIPLVQMAAFALTIVFALLAFVGGLIAIVQRGTGKLMKVACILFFAFAIVFLAMTLAQQFTMTIGLAAVCVLTAATLVTALCGKKKEK